MPVDDILKRNSKRWRILLVLVNLIIVALIIGVCAFYIRSTDHRREENGKVTFTSMVTSMRRVAGGTIIAQQQSCNDWAAYINTHDMTMDEALDFLRTTNSTEGVMAHIIDYESLTGWSSYPDDNGCYDVDYTMYAEGLTPVMADARVNSGNVNITRAYINPTNGELYVGLCHDIEVTTGSKHYLLMRTVPVQEIRDRWVFPSEFKGAEISLINSRGEYIIRSDSMDGLNFWDFISESNDLNADKKQLLKDEMCKDSAVLQSLLDGEGRESYYVTISMFTNEDWYYVGYVPRESIVSSHVDFNLLFIVTIGFILLILIDGSYIYIINKNLRESIAETKLANEAKTRFLSSMSHDIRTPMNAIIGITALSANHTEDPEYIRESLKKITLAGNHLLTLVNDILDISKVESGKLTLNPTVFSLAETVTNLVNIVRPQIKEKGQKFNIHISRIVHEHLFADELRLNQIFINILTNAVKYTHNGGSITLEFHEEMKADSDKTVHLTYIVSDTGIGMTSEFQQTMFEAFSRAADSRIDKIQGSGLGLAITKQMIDIMGGTIDCQSEAGKGTKFTVELDLPIAEKVTDELMLPPMKLLLVDDDEVFLETAEETLCSLGVTVDKAGDGPTAIDMVVRSHEEGHDYPVVIVDWLMPEMDGIETIRRMRAKVGRDVPIIVVSSYDWTDIEEEAIAAGADGFINKPFFRSSVYSTLMKLLDPEEKESAIVPEPENEFAGLNILVAEDNDLNWEIISEILDNFDITSERAENGRICVEMASKPHDYDCILMDIQMPEMNGRDAARNIRKLNDEKLRNIPIIAMTADAFAEDVQACLEAGMNGHVPKPIDVKRIFDEFRKVGLKGRRR